MIVLKNVTKELDKNIIIEDVSIKFEEGKIYGIVGRNGSGKSILFKIISGLIFPTKGSVLINDVDIHKSKELPLQIRVFIDKPSFIPNISGLENLKMLAEIQNKIVTEDIENALKLVNLYEERNKHYSKYSLGMKQKLGIAQVLMENPDIMIFDEPFNGLDEDSFLKIKNVIKKQKDKKKIIILSSHNKEDIESLCDIVYKISDGTIKQS